VVVIVAYQFDLIKKSVVILYDLDSEIESEYERLHDCLSRLSDCGGKWYIHARGRVYDPKYHGGASQLVRRGRLSIGLGQPSYVKTNIGIPMIRIGANELYFFPERLLIFSRNAVGAVSYADLGIISSEKQFIEDESVPRDAKIVDRTWRFVNKNGGPDRRFNNNRELPICLYEEIWLNSPTGLNEILQLSRTGIGRRLDAVVQSLADNVAKKAAMPALASRKMDSSAATSASPVDRSTSGDRVRREQAPAISEARGADHLFPILLDVLCCLMVADGRASRSEKRCIHDLMIELHSPWNDSEIDDRIAQFIAWVQTDGYRKALAVSLKDVEVFKQVGRQDVLLKCLDSVAKADEKMTDRELQLCQRIMAIAE
jgi:uncharacterized tellurite resistance protein B-like protein